MIISGQATIVTGGGSGLGEATAREFVRVGAKVLLVDHDEVAAQAVARDVGALAAAADVADEASLRAALRIGRDAHGPARILVHCAGIGGPPIRLAGKNGPYPIEVFRKLIDVNLIGAFNAARLAAADMIDLPPLARGERGVLILVGSINADDAPVGTLGYTTAKAGVAAMTLVIARDLAARGVRCCTISPGNFNTPMLRRAPAEFLDRLLDLVPFPNDRFGDPEDFAGLARHICENIMLNGEVLRLDAAVRHSQHR